MEVHLQMIGKTLTPTNTTQKTLALPSRSTFMLMGDSTLKTPERIVEGDTVAVYDTIERTLRRTTVLEVAHETGTEAPQDLVKVGTYSGRAAFLPSDALILGTTPLNELKYFTTDKLKTSSEGATVFSGSQALPGFSQDNSWKLNHHFSPYLCGVLWGMRQLSDEAWVADSRSPMPAEPSDYLIEVLNEYGFRPTKDMKQVRVKEGIQRVAHKAFKHSPDGIGDLLRFINSTTPPAAIMRGGYSIHLAFFAGISEVFRPRESYQMNARTKHLAILTPSFASALALQQFYLNCGVNTRIQYRNNSHELELIVPFTQHVPASVTAVPDFLVDKVAYVQANPTPHVQMTRLILEDNSPTVINGFIVK